MNYLLLLYADEQALAGLSPSERIHRAEAGHAMDEMLRTSGRLLVGGQFQATDAVTTLCIQGAEITLTAGSVIATALQLSAFYLINARDLNDAIQVATQMPQAQGSAIEVRPISV